MKSPCQFRESSVAEAAGGLQLRVTASLVLSSSDVLSQAVTLPLTFSGTAVSGEDYSLPGQVPSIVIPANSATGATAQATLSITLVDDETVEAKETLSIGGSVPGFDVAPVELEITDSDRASLSVTGPEGTVDEGGEASFLVRLSHPVDVQVSVDWALVDGSALVVEDVGSADDLRDADDSPQGPRQVRRTASRCRCLTTNFPRQRRPLVCPLSW